MKSQYEGEESLPAGIEPGRGNGGTAPLEILNFSYKTTNEKKKYICKYLHLILETHMLKSFYYLFIYILKLEVSF